MIITELSDFRGVCGRYVSIDIRNHCMNNGMVVSFIGKLDLPRGWVAKLGSSH